MSDIENTQPEPTQPQPTQSPDAQSAPVEPQPPASDQPTEPTPVEQPASDPAAPAADPAQPEPDPAESPTNDTPATDPAQPTEPPAQDFKPADGSSVPFANQPDPLKVAARLDDPAQQRDPGLQIAKNHFIAGQDYTTHTVVCPVCQAEFNPGTPVL